MQEKKGTVTVKGAGIFKDLWHYRGVFFMLTKQQILLFYNRAIFGIAWMVLNPILYLVVIIGVFFKVARISPSSEIPFELVVFSGLIGWNLFSHFIVQSSGALKSFHHLFSKIYFPRIYILFSNILNLLTEFLVGIVMLLIIMYFIGYPLHLSLLYMPLIFFISIFLFAGPVIITSLLSYQYKDFQFLVPFLIQIGFYLSPIWFSPSMIKEKIFIILYNCNPVVGVIIMMRSCILGYITPDYLYSILISLTCGFFLFIIGIIYWVKKKDFLADIGV